MAHANVLNLITDVPKMISWQVLKPLRLAFRSQQEHPKSQKDFARLVEYALRHEIRAGFEHRFITLLFVTVEDRVFCRRYTYSEPSWHSVFLADPRGQVTLDKTIVNISAQVPEDLDSINPRVNKAYEDKLTELGARFLMDGAIEPRAEQSTLELSLDLS